MKKMILTLFARTPVHVGAGNSVGAVDSPVQRERHTKIPIIPGSSLKGVLADLWNDETYKRTDEGKKLFGEDDNNADAKAGSLMVGEARVLAFPVRSAKGMFAWVTCPLALRRFARDAGKEMPELPELNAQNCLSAKELLLNDSVVLEEYRLKSEGECGEVADLLNGLSRDAVWQELPNHLVVLSNEMFSYFCEQACEVVTRIRIDDETGTVAKGALFNQEQVPSESLFYSLCYADENRLSGVKEIVKDKLKEGVLQVGGDASTGLGYCSVEVI
jgi:CRISPR-associated protein Cmr4